MSWPYQPYEELSNPGELITTKDTNNLHFQENFQDTVGNAFDYNARIHFKENETAPEYELYSGSNKPAECIDGLRGAQLDETPLSKAFFSKQNLDYLQQKIIDTIFFINHRAHSCFDHLFSPERHPPTDDLSFGDEMRTI